MDNTIFCITCALIITTIMIGALYFANVVFEPIVFALFAIAVVWPLQKALQTRMPSGLALVFTILLTLVVVIKLTSLVVWGGGQIAQWLTQNLDHMQSLYVASLKWFEAHDARHGGFDRAAACVAENHDQFVTEHGRAELETPKTIGLCWSWRSEGVYTRLTLPVARS